MRCVFAGLHVYHEYPPKAPNKKNEENVFSQPPRLEKNNRKDEDKKTRRPARPRTAYLQVDERDLAPYLF